MELRLLRAALARRRGPVLLAVVAVAIGASVAAALLHVSGDVERQLTRELRALGPNLVVAPREPLDARGGETPAAARPASFLDAAAAESALAAAGIRGAPLLHVAARAGDQPVRVIGADLGRLRALHPSWHVEPDPAPAGPESAATTAWIGVRLARRLGAGPGDTLAVAFPAGAARLAIGARVEAGGAEDEALWMPLAAAQRLAARPGQASVIEARVDGGIARALEVERRLEAGGALDAVPLLALSATEARLLERMRRLMALVTLAALAAAALAAFGTLTDLALERRREIALMKALGAGRRDVVRQFAAEAVAIGFAGGAAGWAFGTVMAGVIGRQVFHSAVAMRWEVPPLVLALSLGVALLASLGPIRLALAVEPAVALKGD